MLPATKATFATVELGLLVVTDDGRRQPVLVRAPVGATVAELAAEVARAAGVPTDPPPALYVGLVPVPPDAPAREAGLVHGSLVGLGVPVADPLPPTTGIEVAVAGGPAAGTAISARPGQVVTIGRAAPSTLAVADPEVSRRHAIVTISSEGGSAVVEDAGSRNGVSWQGYRLDGPATMAPGDVVQLGESVVAVRPAVTPDPVLEPGLEPGTVRFNRPPRILPPPPAHEVYIPAEPEPPANRRFPLAAVLLPLAFGAVLWQVMGGFSPYLLFIVLSPAMLLFNVIGDRRGGRAEYKKKKAEYDEAMGTLDARLAELVQAEEHACREASPDPASLLTIATGPTRRLWERRPDDDDFLHLRLGLADRPAGVSIRVESGPRRRSITGHDERSQPPPARLVPVTVDMVSAGVVGAAGARPSLLLLSHALLAQAATLHGPRDLRVVVITGADQADDWAWTAWLPHTTPADDQGPQRAVAAGLEQAEARLSELVALIAQREEARQKQLGSAPPAGHRILVVLDGARRLRALTGVAELLQDGPAAGIYALCLDRDEASLPAECRATAVAMPATPSRVVVRRPDAEAVEGVLADGLSPDAADRLARALAPVRDLGGDRSGPGAIPTRARYLDVVGLPDIDAGAVAAGWRDQPSGRSTRALLGVAADGPFTVDLAADGPHALIAGTTGAGKSELLQTLVASLALGNRPDQLNVVLVDYKGGAAFSHCAELPHCVGLVTDLDGHLAERALESLTAELKRRERLLAEVGAKDIEGYWSASPKPLPRLVIVIDEFATLVEEVPDFVKGVVGIGMRGRSLGVHIVLATQRPGGVVTADLRANVNMRVCLRVADPTESKDVVDVPDAARIPTNRPGRAYARTGHDELTVFQAARIGGPRPGIVVTDGPRPPVIASPWRFDVLGDPAPAVSGGTAGDDDQETDLAVLVRAVRAAAAAEGIVTQPGPWLPPLPSVVTLTELDAVRVAERRDVRREWAVGLADHPGEQAQRPFLMDLDQTGSVAVVGAVRSGRSTVLRTMAAAMTARSGPDALHLYVIDGGKALAGLGALPHCGAVIGVDDGDRVERLLAFLSAEVQRRQRVLSDGGFASVAEQRASTQAAQPPGGAANGACNIAEGGAGEAEGRVAQDSIAHIVVLLDRLEAFIARYMDRDGGVLVDVLERLLREGPGVGVVFVLATDRTGLTARLTSAIEHRLVLRQADRDDYVFVGLPARSVPAHMPPGRAFWLATMTEMQVALLDSDPSGPAQAAAFATRAARASSRWAALPPAARARRIDPLPDVITLAQGEVLRVGERPAGDAVCTIAVGGDQIEPIDIDLSESGPGFLVVGPPRSGRSTALEAVVRTLAGRGTGERPVAILAPRPSPLRALEGLGGVVALYTDPDQAADELPALVDELDRPMAIVVDDAELVTDSRPAAALERIVRMARDRDIVVVVGATTDDVIQSRFRGWLSEVRRSKAGLLLCPASSYDGEAFDIKLPRSVAGGWPPGRALLVSRGRTAAVQVVQVQ